MPDCVAIVQDLPFRQMVVETAMHVLRSVTKDQAAYKEFMTQFDTAAKVQEGEELSAEKKQEIIRDLVKRVTEGQGCLGGNKETDAEPVHALLQHMLADNFDTSSEEFATLVKSDVEAIKAGASAASTAGRTSRVEAASRILNYIYNSLPANSPLRPTVLLALLSVLSLASDLEALTINSASLQLSLNQWAISSSEKITFLTEASDIFKSANLLSKALEFALLALNTEASESLAEKAVVLTLANETKFDLSEVLKTQGVTAKISGKAAELVKLFTEADELEAVSQGQTWAQSNESYLSGFSMPHFTAEFVVRKLRLIALTTLCGRSTSKQISYSEVSSALSIPETEVEAWVIDAIRANLLKARLSQPASLIKIQSVSSAGTRRFGSEEWQTLERRLQEWKKQVSEARSVIAEAEAVAAQGPPTHQRREGQQGQNQNQNRERGQRREEVAA